MEKRRQRVRTVQLTVTYGQVQEIGPSDFEARLMDTGLLHSAPEARNGNCTAGTPLSDQTCAES